MDRKWFIRAYEDGDERAILELQGAVHGEVPDKNQWTRWWNWKYRHNPAGAPIIWVAQSDDKLVAQYAIIPVKMKIGDELITGSQSVDTMTHPNYRNQGIFEILANRAYEEAEEKGINIVYGFPNQYSYPGFIRKLDWFDVCALEPMIKPLKLENILGEYITNKLLLKICTVSINLIFKSLYKTQKAPKVSGLTIRRVSSFDERINDFWERVRNDFPTMVVRNQEYLNWRYANIPDIDYAIYLAEKEDQILGYMVIKCEKWRGLIFGRIFDLVVPLERQAVAQSLILTATEFLKEAGADLILYRMIGSKAQYKTIRKAGFMRLPLTNWKTRFIARINKHELSEIVLRDPRFWFVQTGDSDAL